MSKYNIIEKYPKGNNEYKTATISYQVAGYGSDIFKAEMVYINSEDITTYAFLSTNKYLHIDTEEDRNEFCEEIKLFQKGGSYRKTHPIVKSQSMILRDKKRKLEEEISDVDRKIREAEEIERQQKFKSYKDDIDYKSLQEFAKSIVKALDHSNRYYLVPVMHIWDGYKLEVWDKQLNKPVYIGVLKEDGVTFRDLKDYEIKM